MSKTVKNIVYSLGLVIYLGIMVSLLCNFYMPLIIVPVVACTWGAIVLVGFLKDLKRFKADIATDANKEWEADAKEYEATYEEEPHDIEWRYETIAIIGFTAMWVIYLIVGFAAR
ncbi:MAG: hypothetical protein SOX72_01495 [Oscillospiraceae bacterium]|nr:hypothetical protein [Oscillospiraceae bacterium]MDY4190879.1 hypothetical protein [Oscillospiraceae bacterium]